MKRRDRRTRSFDGGAAVEIGDIGAIGDVGGLSDAVELSDAVAIGAVVAISDALPAGGDRPPIRPMPLGVRCPIDRDPNDARSPRPDRGAQRSHHAVGRPDGFARNAEGRARRFDVDRWRRGEVALEACPLPTCDRQVLEDPAAGIVDHHDHKLRADRQLGGEAIEVVEEREISGDEDGGP